ncbi:BMP family ABC transporter substrate-binding protein [Bacillus sp. CECT 9360]|uniref:BMP family lipoprotein n=1 Tax=Bacillus sp. CECT 9360 TaxID=2845821 RepID=UPI001E5A1651|nr:BMP family ABC transporter substrate-binding protein [Bacillus sp. CECT 9360]CAH0345294.1 Membrane lipoprotein TmpC [Bacillus sp. CECT 9360]
MKRNILIPFLIVLLLVSSACSNGESSAKESKERVKIGIMLSDAGLGDQSFSDAGFAGLEKARNELDVSFDYREISETKTYEKGLEELVEEENDLIIGLGFSMQEAIDKTAKKYPKQTFLLIDSESELPNVHTVTFKEEEGSYLIGAIAGMKTKSNTVGFVGGMDVPLIRKFEKGFIEGVKAVNPKAKVISEFAGSFGDDKLGQSMAKKMIGQGADYIYPAAGFTGVGVLLEAQASGIYSFGVDTDQFYLAEKAVASSMLKRVDNAIYDVTKEYASNGKLSKKKSQLGIKENGVDIAPIRVISLSASEQDTLDDLREKISDGSITIKP